MTTKPNNEKIPILVDRFVRLAIAQDRALLEDDVARFNRLFDQIEAIKAELKACSGDQRSALLPLYTHANPQVRLKAAIAILAIAPGAAQDTLRKIIDQREYPQAAYARGMLRALEEGRFVPV